VRIETVKDSSVPSPDHTVRYGVNYLKPLTFSESRLGDEISCPENTKHTAGEFEDCQMK
jgi:hypothetical protein